MRKRRGSYSDGLKIIYHAYQASQALRGSTNAALHSLKEAALFVVVLAIAIGLLWTGAVAISYVIRVVN
jgi:hypothetical protein